MNVNVFGAPDVLAQLRSEDVSVYIDLFDAQLGLNTMNVFVEVNNPRFMGLISLTPAKPTIEINIVE